MFIAGAAGIGTDFRLGQRSLTELTRDGVLRDLDPLILDAVVLGTANQLLCLHFAGHLALDDAAIRAALAAYWHAIAAAPRLTEKKIPATLKVRDIKRRTGSGLSVFCCF